MNLIPQRNEYQPLTRLQDRVNRIFENFLTADSWTMPNDAFLPAIDVQDLADKFVVKAELPGVDAKDIHISVQDNVLSIHGEKKEEHEERDKTWFHRESSYGKFSRTLTLPTAIDADKIEATSEAGVLTITLPKAAVAKTRQISVKVKK